jgi:hypothetical protein
MSHCLRERLQPSHSRGPPRPAPPSTSSSPPLVPAQPHRHGARPGRLVTTSCQRQTRRAPVSRCPPVPPLLLPSRRLPATTHSRLDRRAAMGRQRLCCLGSLQGQLACLPHFRSGSGRRQPGHLQQQTQQQETLPEPGRQQAGTEVLWLLPEPLAPAGAPAGEEERRAARRQGVSRRPAPLPQAMAGAGGALWLGLRLEQRTLAGRPLALLAARRAGRQQPKSEQPFNIVNCKVSGHLM